MNLSKILADVRITKMFQTMFGKMVTTHDVEVNKINYDSRKISQGDMFVALKGMDADGHKFLQDAIANGAKVIVVEDDNSIADSFCMHTGVVKIVVENSRIALSKMAANYFGRPSEKLKIIGVTGTNGKTTVSYLIKQLLEQSSIENIKVGLIGTVNYSIGDKIFSSTHTTPESLELHNLFFQMVENNCTYCVMEVSSHSLIQNRVYGINFTASVFTNLTQDHLDFHCSMDEYFKAKKLLFDNLNSDAVAITNIDSDYGEKIVSSTKAKIVKYGIDNVAELQATDINLSMSKSMFKLNLVSGEILIETSLSGKFNIYNLLASFSVVTALGINFNKSITEIFKSLQPATGRFHKINSPFGWHAIIDYAHTPDALENCLVAINQTRQNKNSNSIITVFGAGGNRDKTKRPKMGEIAARLSDIVVVTSDNPRKENPETIIDDILIGINRTENIFVDVDRHDGIFRGLSMAKENDVVLIAGKGHEDYQVVGTDKIHFNDFEVVNEFIDLHK